MAGPSPRPPRSGGGRDGGPGLQRPSASLHFSPASLSLYPWDKCLIPQGVKGKINHPGEISQPADLAGERQREIGCLADWLGPPLRGGKMLALRLQMGDIRVGESRPRHLGKSLLMRFWGRWPSPLPGPCPPSGPSPASSLPPSTSGPVTQRSGSSHFGVTLLVSVRGTH